MIYASEMIVWVLIIEIFKWFYPCKPEKIFPSTPFDSSRNTYKCLVHFRCMYQFEKYNYKYFML